MERDMGLVAEILEQVKVCYGEFGNPAEEQVVRDLPDRDRTQVLYHVRLLKNAGFIGTPSNRPTALTWAGHDLLEKLAEQK